MRTRSFSVLAHACAAKDSVRHNVCLLSHREVYTYTTRLALKPIFPSHRFVETQVPAPANFVCDIAGAADSCACVLQQERTSVCATVQNTACIYNNCVGAVEGNLIPTEGLAGISSTPGYSPDVDLICLVCRVFIVSIPIPL